MRQEVGFFDTQATSGGLIETLNEDTGETALSQCLPGLERANARAAAGLSALSTLSALAKLA